MDRRDRDNGKAANEKQWVKGIPIGGLVIQTMRVLRKLRDSGQVWFCLTDRVDQKSHGGIKARAVVALIMGRNMSLGGLGGEDLPNKPTRLCLGRLTELGEVRGLGRRKRKRDSITVNKKSPDRERSTNVNENINLARIMFEWPAIFLVDAWG